MMDGPTPEHFTAVRKFRREADKLRTACVAAANGSALISIAYNQEVVDQLPLDQMRLLGNLRHIQ